MTTVLQEASALIDGPRRDPYGSPKVSFGRIAELWNSYLYAKYGIETELTTEDVAWLMVQLKMARQMNKPHRDNLADAAGYVGLIEQL